MGQQKMTGGTGRGTPGSPKLRSQPGTGGPQATWKEGPKKRTGTRQEYRSTHPGNGSQDESVGEVEQGDPVTKVRAGNQR